jgi:prevent-host-death family protein
MQTLNIKEARACFSRLLDKTERGETVVITRYGKQSARLVPIVARAKGLPSLGAFRAGIVVPRTGLAATVIASRREERY